MDRTLSRIARPILLLTFAIMAACAFTARVLDPDPVNWLAVLSTATMCIGLGITLKLSSGDKSVDGIKALRELAGEIHGRMKDAGQAFNDRKKKRDAGEEVELWPDDTEADWDNLNADYTIVRDAISEEENAAKVVARLAEAGKFGSGDDSGDSTGMMQRERRVVIPAAVRRTRLKAFRGEHASEDAYTCGQWIRGILLGDRSAREWCDDHSGFIGMDSRALSEGVNIKGGALVPPQFETAVIRMVEEYGVAASECQPVAMGSDTYSQPRRTGGVTLYALTENEAVTESETGWDAIQLMTRKWGALIKYSAELNEDSTINLAEFLALETAHAIAKKQDQCLFLGDGTSTYQGITGIVTGLAAGSEVTAASGNTAFSTLDLTDFESMIGKLPQYAEANAKWFISKAGWAASMMRLADAAGGNTAEVIQGMRQRTFLGYPVVITQVTNSTLTAQTSTQGLCFLGDMRQTAMLGLRGQLRMKVAEERYVEYDQLGFLGFIRFDVNVHEVGDASNPGSMIQLLTPGS